MRLIRAVEDLRIFLTLIAASAITSSGFSQELREIRTCRGHVGRVWCVAFAPDGKTIASGGADGNITRWDTTTGSQQAALRGHRDDIKGLAFHPVRKILISCSKDGRVKAWDFRLASRSESPILFSPKRGCGSMQRPNDLELYNE
jgi:WD40 repeat protein